MELFAWEGDATLLWPGRSKSPILMTPADWHAAVQLARLGGACGGLPRGAIEFPFHGLWTVGRPWLFRAIQGKASLTPLCRFCRLCPQHDTTQDGASSNPTMTGPGGS